VAVSSAAVNSPRSIHLLIPLVAGSAAVILTIFIHALPLSVTVALVRREKTLRHLGIRFRKDMTVVMQTISYAFVAHLIEIALWAALFMIYGEFSDFVTAYYHSAVNYTSLGYGDIVMSPTWRCWALWRRQTACFYLAYRQP
jgi:hypothetical protein